MRRDLGIDDLVEFGRISDTSLLEKCPELNGKCMLIALVCAQMRYIDDNGLVTICPRPMETEWCKHIRDLTLPAPDGEGGELKFSTTAFG